MACASVRFVSSRTGLTLTERMMIFPSPHCGQRGSLQSNSPHGIDACFISVGFWFGLVFIINMGILRTRPARRQLHGTLFPADRLLEFLALHPQVEEPKTDRKSTRLNSITL